LKSIQALKGEHPYWGYRRIWAYLRRRTQKPLNHKRIHRIMKEHDLLVPKNLNLKAPRKAVTVKPRTIEPNVFWGIDMTKVMIPRFGWVYVHVVIDWGSKKLLSTKMSVKSKSLDWIEALNEAVNMQYPDGIKDAFRIPSLVSDHGSQPTSSAFMKCCSELKIEQIFASYCNPKGNADTERVIRTIKEDLIWSKEFDNVSEFESALKQWQVNYNSDYPHSSLGYMTPYEYERWFNASAA
jgi:transposase InsO family protein